MQQLRGQASDAKRKRMLEHAVSGIRKHTDVLKGLTQTNGGETLPEHGKRMEGLVAEALKDGIKEAPGDGHLRDVAIIAQYRRMAHYDLAGFGSAVADAKALGRTVDASQLEPAVDKIYRGDAVASQRATA